jgi:cobalt-zinc-cadmium efflux system protein
MTRDHDHAREHPLHSHARGHVHAPTSFGRAFAVGIILNTLFVLRPASASSPTRSRWSRMPVTTCQTSSASSLSGRQRSWPGPPSSRYTYGLRSSSILAALFNAVFLLITVGVIGWEAVLRLVHPESVVGTTMIVVAAIGIAVNGVTAWLFAKGRRTDLNIRRAYIHMAADATVSVGVVAAGLLILVTGWLWLDPVVSIIIVVVIVAGTWGLLWDSLSMSLDAVPPGITPETVQSFLAGLPGVTEVHDLHIWSTSTTEPALTAHLVRPDASLDDQFLADIAHELEHRFGIRHATMQIENGARECRLAPASVV